MTHWFRYFIRAPVSALMGKSDPTRVDSRTIWSRVCAQMARDEFWRELDEGAFVG